MKHLLLIFIYKIVLPLPLKMVGVRVRNKKNLNEVQPIIIVANHNSHLDTMALLSSLPSSALALTHPVATAAYFGKKKCLAFLSNLLVNTVLIQKHDNQGGSKALEVLDQTIKAGHSLILFPEGTRGKPGQLEEFRTGVGVLLLQNPDVKYLPVWIEGTGNILPKGALWLRPHVATVIVGQASLPKATTVAALTEEVKNAVLQVGKVE
ncbi:MAG: lysophospholipid acyltransferase family protein [Flavobacteriales bacterium]